LNVRIKVCFDPKKKSNITLKDGSNEGERGIPETNKFGN